ncbi:MAG: mannose-1-phosphate guanylyltransferase/mannose-6-phosphate isomerase, partial [Acidobacteria bacterium]|nr:mannose-1-phosphate guanylyltransferase/mannose-6-phosphate isomerase [Acidobacteriota bacterium]
VVAGKPLQRAIRAELSHHEGAGILLEPEARNTGPAALLATRWVWEQDRKATVLILPADHCVQGVVAFRRAVERARQLAGQGYLVTFGIRPQGAATEFGYILRGERLKPSGRRVSRFVEKPTLPAARRLIRRRALWNSGMFVWQARAFLDEAVRCEPSFGRWLDAASRSGSGSPRAHRAFTSLPTLPVDKAVLERSNRVAVVEAEFRWSDLGSWSALYDLARKDASKNVGIGHHVALHSANNLVYSEEGLCVLHGVEGLLLVRSGDVVLVCPRREASEVKSIVQELRKRGLGGYL